MSFWFLIQILINVVLVAGFGVVWIKLNRPQKDDPRMSKGLQLLQSKIAVLEDLSDRTETQVQQLTAILENKCKELQEKIIISDKQIQKIDQSMQKSLDVAQIFQDKIPHEEIIERQSTIKYVKAARLANQGRTADEIAKEVDLTRGEIEFIAKVNRDQLMFNEDSLPEWAHAEPSPAQSNQDSMKNLAKKFEQVQNNHQTIVTTASSSAMPQNFVELNAQPPVSARHDVQAPPPFMQNHTMTAQSTVVKSAFSQSQNQEGEVVFTSSGKEAIVRPVLFPKIDLDKDLL